MVVRIGDRQSNAACTGMLVLRMPGEGYYFGQVLIYRLLR